jgi:hypothetical protein
VLHLQAVAATRLPDGPFGMSEDSLHVGFDGPALATRVGRTEPTGLQLPSTTGTCRIS